MSPASQGALEVERYIGSCLISSNVRAGLHGKAAVCRKQEQPTIRGKSRGCYTNGQTYPLATVGEQQCQVQYGPGGWTGAPLISMTSPRRCNQHSPSLTPQQQQQQQQQQTCADQQQQQQVPPGGHLHKSPLSRLAIHTQGAPLILAGRFHNRGKVHSNNGNTNNNNNNNGNPNGAANTLCGSVGNVVGNYVHSNANPSMTSNVNGATRCSASRIVAQRPAEAAPKKPATTMNPKTANPECPSGAGKENAGSSSIANIDSLSIASDESSGSNNSENSLPRIIKPRKRRKKDRKPLNVVAGGIDAGKPEESQQRQQQQQQQQPPPSSSLPSSTSSAVEPTNGVLVNAKSYMAGAPSCYEPRLYETPPPPHLRNYRRPPLGHRENAYGGCRAPLMQEAADMRQRYAHHRHAQVKVLDDNRNVVTPMRGAVPPKGYRHYHVAANMNGNGNCCTSNNSNNNLSRRYVHEYSDAMTPRVACEVAARDCMGGCQCRYCDPSGLIWDVDRNGYSPFLTATSGVEYCRGHFGQMPLFLTPPGPQQQQRQERVLDRLFDEHPRLHDDVRDTCSVVLRRSWSDPTSYFSYEEVAAPARDVGVIGDRGQPDSSKRRIPWRGDSIGVLTNSAKTDPSGSNAAGVASPKGLEVSTEIITSPNGHRDLEIKFYSSPSPNAPVEREEDKSSSAGDDEDDDFSDIWSYHESKLQQDFRTLLQAEE